MAVILNITTRNITFRALFLLCAVALAGAAGPVDAQSVEAQPAEATESRSQQAVSIPYTVEFVDLPSNALADQVRSGSQLVRLKDAPPASILGLRRRIRADVERINEILRSAGYYGARVVPELERPPSDAEGAVETSVTVKVRPGPQYVFNTLLVDWEPEFPGVPDDLLDPIVSLEAQPARAADLIAAEREVVRALTNSGYPFARVLPRRSEVDHARTTIMSTMRFDTGSYHDLGQLVFSGLETVEPAYLERLVPWAVGDMFDWSALVDYRQDLIDSRLFTSVKVEPVDREAAVEGQPLNVDVSVKEGLLRTMGATVNYARDTGFGGGVSWQHRNFFGQAETFDAKVQASELNQSLSLGLTKPAFRRRDQVLSTGFDLLHEDNDAFEEYSATVGVGLERNLWTDWRGGAGVTLEAAELTDDNGIDQSYLVGVPLTLSLDKSDSLLDPKRGYRLGFEVTPYAGQFSGTALFARTAATGTYYYPLSDQPRSIVLAARLKLGSVVGESSAAIPANKRFYAGGGGSVRGFGYQLIGPLDDENDPRGGRSVIETGLEARIPVTNTISIVPFVDGGLVSADVVPSLSGPFRVGAGLGGRYDTPVGPLRIDVALPVNRRSGVDDGFQFYISFGQAF